MWLKVTKFGSHSLRGFRVAANSVMVWDKNPPAHTHTHKHTHQVVSRVKMRGACLLGGRVTLLVGSARCPNKENAIKHQCLSFVLT